jgi:predicted RNase H-like nuclease (RuvC/YqgF family)
MEFMEIYAEGGMIAVCGFLLVYMIVSMQKRMSDQQSALKELEVENRGQTETIENVESILLKLLSRMDKTDDRIGRRFDDLVKEINDADNQLSEIKGVISRLNGKH